jgi:DNA-binding winged helix-turn-helix (wHTH) protein
LPNPGEFPVFFRVRAEIGEAGLRHNRANSSRPFGPPEAAMRVRFGECLLDSETRELHVRGEPVHLQPKAFQFLELLLQNRPKALSKDAIHEKLWPGTFVSDGTLTSLLAEVRDAVLDDARRSRFIRTVHRFGYAFCGEVQLVRDQASPVAGQRSACWLVRGRRRYALATGESILGRDPGAAVSIDDRSVSRRHARIVVEDEGATLEDLGSKNGTFIGEQKVGSPTPLSDGDRIRIGSVALTLRIFPVPDSTETASGR